jgi:hypothetical protein
MKLCAAQTAQAPVTTSHIKAAFVHRIHYSASDDDSPLCNWVNI